MDSEALDRIDVFVHSFTNDEVESVFEDYESGCFDLLLRCDRENISSRESKYKAIRNYLIQTIMVEQKCERQTKFLKCVEEMSRKDFIELIQNDQYFSEPLMHTLNQGKRDYSLSRVGKENIEASINN